MTTLEHPSSPEVHSKSMAQLEHRRALTIEHSGVFGLIAGLILIATATPLAFSSASATTFRASAPRPSRQWPMLMFGPTRRGRTPVVGAETTTLTWQIPPESNDVRPAHRR